MKVRRALLSVSDKTGLVEFATGLSALGVALISTGGTAAALRDAGLEVTDVAEITGQAEILGGRVKSLHPAIHAGILARPDHPEDDAQMAEAGFENIDLVVINLYSFEEWANRRGVSDAEVIEHIDVGGPASIRAAAKNHARVGVVSDPEQYGDVLTELRDNDGALSDTTRRALATQAFMRTARYDAAIGNWMTAPDEDFPDTFLVDFGKVRDLRYGENPHQRAAYYAERGARSHLLSRVEQLHGKELSFNNLLDLEGGRALAAEFELPACVIIKHNNPCGVAVAGDIDTAEKRARACDPMSAFGGVIVVNRPVTAELGRSLAEVFVEVLLAPGYSDEALEALTQKPNTRLLLHTERRRPNPGERDFRRVSGGVLVQDRDSESEDREAMKVAGSHEPSESQWGDLLFGWRVAKHVKSNAIVLTRDLATVGIGAGQMSRVDSVKIAIDKSEVGVEGSSLASDAFFPFPDAPEIAMDAGIAAIAQPGGSMRDEDVLTACENRGVPMVYTNRRHFRH